MPQIVIGTAGHIDHGKTALVKALTGVDTDRLEEEKIRGMTIDIGFAFLNDEITIIDVPGHEKFVRNMVAGVATIQVALLVVAADDGVMPQTREHLQIMSLLEIPRGVIALTKIDLINDSDWLDLVEEEIRGMVAGTFLESAPIIRTSVNPETGIEDVRQALFNQTLRGQDFHDRGFFRLPVDRVFVKTGFGVVVTGTVTSGELSVGNVLICLPAGTKGKVRGLQSHGKSVSTVYRGDRAAVNLSGIEKEQVWRGSELISQGWLIATDRLIANITLITTTDWKLKSRQRVRIHIGTAEVLGRATVLGNTLEQGQSGPVILRMEKPIVAAMNDRFVIRSYSPMNTIGGGVILDPHPEGKWKEVKGWGKGLSIPIKERFKQFVDRFHSRPKTINEWAKIFHLPVDEIRIYVKETGLRFIENSELVYHPKHLDESKKEVVNALLSFHKKNPYRISLSGEAIKKALGFKSGWYEFVLQDLIQAGMVRSKNAGYALVNHKISLTASDQIKADSIVIQLKKSRAMPLTVAQLMESTNLSENVTLGLLYVLKGQEITVEIHSGLWMYSENLSKITADIKKYFTAHNKLMVSDFKEITGLTRKTAIPLLEYLDIKGITERRENVRIKGEQI